MRGEEGAGAGAGAGLLVGGVVEESSGGHTSLMPYWDAGSWRLYRAVSWRLRGTVLERSYLVGAVLGGLVVAPVPSRKLLP